MSRRRLLSPTLRLALALTLSGTVLTGTAAGAWAWAPSALLWAAPFLVAMRCLPALVAVPLVLVVGTAGRLVGGASDLVAAGLASAAVLPLLLVDRALERRLPRASLVVWPLGIVLVSLLCAHQPWGPLVSPAPGSGVLADVRASLAAWAVPALAGLMGQAFGALGTLHNRPADRVSAEVRETGVRWAAVTGIFIPTIVLGVVALQGAP